MPGRQYYLRGRDDRFVKAYELLATEIAVELGANLTTAERDFRLMVDLEMEIANVRHKLYIYPE